MRRRRRILLCASLCLLLLAGVALCRHILAQKAVETIFTQITGFPIRVGSVQIAPWESRFAADDIELFNPPEFDERLFADIPRFDVDYTAWSFLGDRHRFTRADLHIRELLIVKNIHGQSNMERLRGWRARRRPEPQIRFQIDALNLRLGRVVFKDYSSGRPEERSRDLDMTVTFRNVTETTDINRRIFWAVVKRMWIPSFLSTAKTDERQR